MSPISFPRDLARIAAALATAAAATVAQPAFAQLATGVVGDGAAVGPTTACPGGAGVVVDAFTLSASVPTDASKIVVDVVPASSFTLLDHIEVRTDNLSTVLASVIPIADSVEIPFATPLAIGTAPTQYRILLYPKSQAAMPPAPAGAQYAMYARVTNLVRGVGAVVQFSFADTFGGPVTIDNQPPADVLWSDVRTTATSVLMSWVGTPNVLVLKRLGGAVTEFPAKGQTYAAGAAIGGSTVAFAGVAGTWTDTPLTTGKPYYYRVFQADSCGNWSLGSPLGPVTPGGTPEGDARAAARTPVVGILNPATGPVTTPFKVQVRVFSPTDVNGAVQAIQGASVSVDNGTTVTSYPLAANAAYGAAPDSGIYEVQLGTAGAPLAQGRYTLRASATNAAGSVSSAGVGVVVGAGRGDGNLLVRDNSSQLCADCHAHQTHSSEATGTKYGSWFVGCRACHAPHNTTNASLIADVVTPPGVNGGPKPPARVYFGGASATGTGYSASGGASAPGQASFANGDASGPCQVCHTRTSYYTRDGLGITHNPGSTCTTCHQHAKGMSASCSGCHGDPNRIGISGADALVTAAPPVDPQKNSSGPMVGAHLAHVNQATYRSTPLQCANCHTIPNQHNGSSDPLTFNGLGSTGTIATYNGTTCSTYCHGVTLAAGGTNATPAWNGGDTMGCTTCHGAPPPAPHVSRTDCGSCHGPGYSQTSVNKSTHINGVIDVSSMACSGCHGDVTRTAVASATALDANGDNLVRAAPPVDASGASSGAKVGAHLAHVNQGDTGAPGALSNALGCALCHPVPTSGTASGTHRDGQPSVTFTGLAAATGASYAASSHTCASTYCHGNFQGGAGANAISWGTGTNAKLSCTSCHGAPPAYPHPSNATCASCHGGYTATTVAAATHVDGAVTKSSQSCTSCHGDVAQAAGVAVLATPTLAAPGANAAATSMDASGQTATTAAGVGAHRAHLFKTNLRSAAIACAECHALPASDTDKTHATGSGTGGARATLAFGSLATGAVSSWSGAPVSPVYSGSTTASGGTTGGSCASTYCHGNFKNGLNASMAWPGTYSATLTTTSLTCNSCHGRGTGATATPPGGNHPNNTSCGSCHTGYTATTVNATNHMNGQLDVANLTCSSCHGDSTRTPVATATALDANAQNLVLASPPIDSTGAATGGQVGAHLAHVNQADAGAPGALSNAITCVVCHVVPTSTSHSDGVALVTFSGLATTRGATAAAIDASNNCSSTYCHGNWTYGNGANLISWGTGTLSKQGCASCHPNSPSFPHPGNQTCADCHPGYSKTGATTGTVNAATHVDGQTTKSSNDCTSCHGDLAQAAGVAVLATPALSAPGANAATTSKDTAGNTATTVNAVGAHRAHLFKTNLRGAAIACTECHALPPTQTDRGHATGTGTGGARATLTWGTLATGAVNNWSGAAVAPSYAGSTSAAGGTTGGSCASTYCHGNFRNGANASMAWPGTYSSTATTTSLTCNSCHGRGTGASATPPGGTHPNNTNCGSCHTGYTATTVNATAHMNGALDVVTLTCATCHGDTTRTPVATATALDALGQNLAKSAPPLDQTGAASGTAVGAHVQHVNQGATAPALSSALACTSCHPVPTTTNHANGTVQVTFGGLATTGGVTPTPYNFSTHTCASTYCHGNFSGGAGANAITWGTGALAKLSCTSCHGAPPTFPHPGNATCASCHTGYTSTTVAAATHVDGVVTKSSQSCTQCHGDVAQAAGAAVVATPLLSAPGANAAATSMDTAGQTASTASGVGAHRAHLQKTNLRSAVLACTECHALPPSDTDKTHATGTGSGGARATLTWGTLATGAINAWSGVPVAPTYSGSTTAAGGTTGGSCASTYCHGNFKNGLNASMAWPGTYSATLTTTSLNCNSCHGRGTGATATPPGGTHPNNSNCGSCHTGYTGTSVNLAVHMNGALDVANLTCSSCHGDVTRTAVASATALDAGAQNLVKDSPPVDSQGVSTGTAVGAHLQHVNQGATAPALSNAITCSSCHTVPTSTTHSNGSVDVTFGGLATTGGITPTPYDFANHNCASTYCHGNFRGGAGTSTINWGTGTLAKLGCTSCHGAPPAYPHPANATCASCHTGYTATTVTASTHVDGVVTKSVSGCSQCHGDRAVTTATVASPLAAAPGETGTATTADTAGQTATTAAGVGVHRAHLANTTWRSTPIACADCHALPPSDTDVTHATGAGTGGARATLTWSAFVRSSTFQAHTPAYAGSTSGTGGTTGGTCSNTYCHAPRTNDTAAGVNLAPSWTAAGSVVCGSCHGLPPNTPNHDPAATNCGSCHPGYTISSVNPSLHMNGVLDGGESAGGLACNGCHDTLFAAMNSTTSGTHNHYMNNSNATSPTIAGRTLGATTDTNRDCLVCHVDHNFFRPDLNTTNGGRAKNLRTSIATAPAVATATTYTNTDFDSTLNTGVCTSCHQVQQTKSFADGTGTTVTPVIGEAAFGASAHDYAATSTYGGTLTTTFNGNCSKCHTDDLAKDKQTSANKFGMHDSSKADLMNPMGSTVASQFLEENVCYRCHSASTDVNPGGGPAKTSTTTDYYGVQTMAGGATDIFRSMQEGTAGGPGTTQAATTLYFRNNNTTNPVDGPAPTAYILASGTYAGTTTFSQFDMALAQGATTTSRTNTSGTTSGVFLRFGQFISPPVAAAVTIPSGSTFQIRTRSSVSVSGDTEFERFQIWRRTAAGVNTAFNTAVQQETTAMPTTATNGSYSFVTNTAITLNPGDGLVLEIEASKQSTTSSTVTESYGNFATDGASLVLPVSITFQSGAATAASGRHDVASYTGIHKPSAVDENGAYIGANKHVSCADCHDPHAARPGLHTRGSNLAGPVLTGADAVQPTYNGTSWQTAAAITYAQTSVGATTPEAYVCFKCHSSYNTAIPMDPATAASAPWNVGGGGFTNLALEFSTSNQSYHPVLGALPATDPGTNGSSQLNATQLLSPWTPGQTMTCTDCHNADAASPAAQGPHGSAVRYMLAGTNRAWPYTVAGATSGTLFTVSGTNSGELGLGTANGLFCRNCHPQQNSTASNSMHTQIGGTSHGSNSTIGTCVACHLRVPHGGKVSRLIVTTNAPARYRTVTPNAARFLKNTAYRSYTVQTNMGTSCGQHSSGGSGTGNESW